MDRDFVAAAPNRCWVADFTHVAAWAGTVYVAFVVDTSSRRIVGWSAATTKHTELVLAALEMGLWQRGREGRAHQPGQLIHHSDAGSHTTTGCTVRSATSHPQNKKPPTTSRTQTPQVTVTI
ncbi:DDE-type integrase/transposase/recombinase [Streptomyces sp. NPDC060064]|uniref:DDE-type integrase/transposase/recombinase n=1 Tax=Streptomyces sp. NPDC060064 TaxID=3347049 RepID=UPI00367AA059